MAVWFIDGFDHYTVDTYGAGGIGSQNSRADVAKKWTTEIQGSAGSFTISPYAARQQPGQGLMFLTSETKYVKNRPGGAVTTMFAGVAVFAYNWSTSPMYPIIFFDGTTEQCSVRFDSTGHVVFSRAGTTLATSSNTLNLNTWYYIEAKCLVNNSTGQYEVRVNGSSSGWIAPATNQNTRYTSNNQITGIGFYSNGASGRLDDYYMADTTGTNTDFLGVCTIATLRPCAPGHYAEWTPNYGPNFSNVNEIYPDADATFNQSSTANQIDSFTMPKLPMASGSVFAVQHDIYARQDVGGARTLAAFQRSGTTDSPGTTQALTSSYTMLLDIKNADPLDDGAWTIAKVEACEFGYKLIS